MNKYNIGIVGALAEITPEHIKAIHYYNNIFKIIAVNDLNKNILKNTFNNLPIITTNYKEIIQNKNIDTILNLTPNHMHTQINLEALKNNKTVICEKPLLVNINEIDEFKNIDKKKIITTYHFNFLEIINQFNNIKYDLGKITDIHFTSSESLDINKKWILKPESGGLLIDMIPNVLSVLRTLINNNVDENFDYVQIINSNIKYNKKYNIDTKVNVQLNIQDINCIIDLDWQNNKNILELKIYIKDDADNIFLLNYSDNSIYKNNKLFWKGNDKRYLKVYEYIITKLNNGLSNFHIAKENIQIINNIRNHN